MNFSSYFTRPWLLIALFFSALCEADNHYDIITSKPKISIVIDDLGDNAKIARKMLSLPGQMTAAILPQTPHAKLISRIAAENGHDIIMHLPMEAYSRSDLLGPGALLQNMDKATFIETFQQNIATLPNIIGFNNHMGSLLTSDQEKMQWLMSEAKLNSLLFLDSKTSKSSIAETIAQQVGIPSLGRDIFLDHKGSLKTIEQQFNRAQKIATRTGQVIVICHPYPETLAFLQQRIDEIGEEFELVGLSELLVQQNNFEGIRPSLAK